jgi:CheY-like chemotaxis protein
MFCITSEPEVPVSSWSLGTGVARVLLADSDLTSRLTVKTILTAAGYSVDGAASASEAVARLEEGEYQLVLADLSTESHAAGPNLLAYARQRDNRPATALISSRISGHEEEAEGGEAIVHVANDQISELLEKVADLISHRADRRIQRSLR